MKNNFQKPLSPFKMILTALFAALICVATMLVQIPIPATGGYANLGDGVILICAFLLHPLQATIAAGFGSMLADLLAGYIAYAPGTLVIKAGVALIAGLGFKRSLNNRSAAPAFVSLLLSSAAAESFMVLGYFFYEAVLLGFGSAAAAAVPGNIGQAVVGIILACSATPVLLRSEGIQTWLKKSKS